MTSAARGLDKRRAVQTVARYATGRPTQTGSGYLLSGDLVLTAEHVVRGATGVSVRIVDAPGWVREVPARVEFADDGLDVAVLRLEVAEPVPAPVAFGYPAGRVDCETLGFPLFKRRDEVRDQGGAAAAAAPHAAGVQVSYRDSHHAFGSIAPGSDMRSGTLELALKSPAPGPPGTSSWAGMSGAPVFADDLLIGVVVADHQGEGPGWLTAQPVERWYTLPEDRLAVLRELVGLPGDGELIPVGGATTGGFPFSLVIQGQQLTFPLPYEIPLTLHRDEFFAGRSQELTEVAAQLRQFPVVTIAGMAGVGKTELAVQAAWRVWKDERHFRGGVLYVDLQGYSDRRLSSAAALSHLLRSLQVPQKDMPGDERDLLRLYHAVLDEYARHDLRLLILLDNAAGQEQYVRSLLPPEGVHATLVTSRHSLVLGKAQTRHELPLLDPDSALHVLRLVLDGDGLVDSEPEAAKQIVYLCGYLPLALQISAAALADRTSRSLAVFAKELADAHQRLDKLSRQERSVRAAFDLSYQRLPDDQAALFCLVALSPGPDVSTESAARLADAVEVRREYENAPPNWFRSEKEKLPPVPIPYAGQPTEADVERMLTDLARAHLISEAKPNRWRFHDLVRLYAEELLEKSPRQGQVLGNLDKRLAYHRFSEYLRNTTFDAAQPLSFFVAGLIPEFSRFAFGEEQGLAWLDDEYETLLAVTRRAQLWGDDETAARMPVYMAPYLRLRRRLPDWLDLLEGAVRAAVRIQHRLLAGMALYYLCQGLLEVGRLEQAAAAGKRAVNVFREDEDEFYLALALDRLGEVLARQGKLDEAVGIHRMTVSKLHGMEGAYARKNLGSALFKLGEYEEAAEVSGEAAARFVRLPVSNPLAAAEAMTTQALALGAMGDSVAAYLPFGYAEMIFREHGDLHCRAKVLNGYGRVQLADGDPEKAFDTLLKAGRLVTDTDDVALEAEILRNLGEASEAAGDEEAARKYMILAAETFRVIGDKMNARAVEQRLRESSGRKPSLGARLGRLARISRRAGS